MLCRCAAMQLLGSHSRLVSHGEGRWPGQGGEQMARMHRGWRLHTCVGAAHVGSGVPTTAAPPPLQVGVVGGGGGWSCQCLGTPAHGIGRPQVSLHDQSILVFFTASRVLETSPSIAPISARAGCCCSCPCINTHATRSVHEHWTAKLSEYWYLIILLLCTPRDIKRSDQ